MAKQVTSNVLQQWKDDKKAMAELSIKYRQWLAQHPDTEYAPLVNVVLPGSGSSTLPKLYRIDPLDSSLFARSPNADGSVPQFPAWCPTAAHLAAIKLHHKELMHINLVGLNAKDVSFEAVYLIVIPDKLEESAKQEDHKHLQKAEEDPRYLATFQSTYPEDADRDLQYRTCQYCNLSFETGRLMDRHLFSSTHMQVERDFDKGFAALSCTTYKMKAKAVQEYIAAVTRVFDSTC